MSDRPRVSLRELQDGTYSINDLADMNEALDEQEELQRRMRERDKQER